MKVNRRTFLGLTAATGLTGALGSKTAFAGESNENLSVFVSDIHVGGTSDAGDAPFECLQRFVDEVLAMNPRPKRVVSLGDLAFLRGDPKDYARSAPELKRLEKAGIELVFCMGNHDRRSAFSKEWPGHLDLSPVPGRAVRVVSLGTADLVVLDCMQGTDDRPLTDMGPFNAKLHEDVCDWCLKTLPKMTRPFFVCSHYPVYELKMTTLKNELFATWVLKNVPMCKGYIHGHDHRWRPEWVTCGWDDPRLLRVVCLPSNGLWGDIGFATFRTYKNHAVCSLELRDFFYPRQPKTSERPLAWRVKVRETVGQKVTFAYDRGE